jgi:hypothetical protein
LKKRRKKGIRKRPPSVTFTMPKGLMTDSADTESQSDTSSNSDSSFDVDSVDSMSYMSPRDWATMVLKEEFDVLRKVFSSEEEPKDTVIPGKVEVRCEGEERSETGPKL